MAGATNRGLSMRRSRRSIDSSDWNDNAAGTDDTFLEKYVAVEPVLAGRYYPKGPAAAFVERETLKRCKPYVRPGVLNDNLPKFSEDRNLLIGVVNDLHTPSRLRNEIIQGHDRQNSVEHSCDGGAIEANNRHA